MKDYQGELFAATQRLLPKHGLSRLAGKLAESKSPKVKNALIKQFVNAYDINMSEALESDPYQYESFNALFTRALKPDARPIDHSTTNIVCPVDGTVSQIGNVINDSVIQAKGKSFSATTLLGSEEDADHFEGGNFATIYLSPKDYHRVHMPISGKLISARYIPGQLFSVNNSTANNIQGLFARNERLVCMFNTDIGKMAYVMVGAMMVAGIGTVWKEHYLPGHMQSSVFTGSNSVELAKGEQLGHFNFGSTVVMLFEEDKIQWNEEYQSGTTTRLGEPLAHIA
jgi:phosphatidylserine decarboxylase